MARSLDDRMLDLLNEAESLEVRSEKLLQGAAGALQKILISRLHRLPLHVGKDDFRELVRCMCRIAMLADQEGVFINDTCRTLRVTRKTFRNWLCGASAPEQILRRCYLQTSFQTLRKLGIAS